MKSFFKRTLIFVLICCLLLPASVSAAPKVKLNKHNLVLTRNDSFTLKVKNTKSKPTWSSQNKKIATVSKKGIVKAKKAGTTKVTASVGGKKYTCKVTVPNSSYVLCKNNTYKITPSKLTGSVTWKSSKKSVASVNKKGKITAKSPGTCLITAKAGKKSYNISITVSDASLNTSAVKLKKGETCQLAVKNAPGKTKWYSDDSGVASVTSNGIVKANLPGKAMITAKLGKASLKCKIEVQRAELEKTHKHSWTVTSKTEPDCENEGLISYKCTSCAKTFADALEPLGHDYKEETVAPTATSHGYTIHTCSRDSSHNYIDHYTEPTLHEHTWDSGVIVKKATQTQKGLLRYTCKECGEAKEEELPFQVAPSDEYSLTTDKTDYLEDEQIQVTAKGTSESWVGIYYETDEADKKEAIYQYKAADTDHVSGESYVLQNQTLSDSRADMSALPAGTYKIILYKNESGAVAAYRYITIQENPDSKRLRLNKTEYRPGEGVRVTARGTGADWVGLYLATDSPDPDQPNGAVSIYWYNVASEGHFSGGTYTVNSDSSHYNAERADYRDLPAGEYKVVLMANGGYEVTEEVTFRVNGSAKAEAPVSAEYILDNQTDGLADGTVTVKLNDQDVTSKDIVMYWADDNGALEGYTSLAKYKINGQKTVTHKMYENTIIPEGATRLLVYTSNQEGLSDQCVSVSLPEGCNYIWESETALTEFDMVSDVHITDRVIDSSDCNYKNNEHFLQMLQDVVQNNSNSCGIFINGDIADTGEESEYQKMNSLKAQIVNTPPIYMSIGNHDLSKDFSQEAALFIKYAETGTDSVYYDRQINGFHYIFMGGEASGLEADLSEKQLTWLDSLLAADTAADSSKPVFVMLHQPLYNTVAGSFEGQGWNGVKQEQELRAILSKYPQVILFNGHSHWELNSEGCMHEKGDGLPTIFNTASAGYLWSSYDIIGGEAASGSHGYFVKVYNDRILVLGREFSEGKYIPSAMFVVNL